MAGRDAHWMARAIRAAAAVYPPPHPNPRVGCVVVRDGRERARAAHRRAGEPHAEALALEAAGEGARGATAYVTLEPCSHHGRTPPCADALIAAGVARVVVAQEDPNPEVAGEGLARLRAAGVTVGSGVLRNEAEELNRGFLQRHRHGRPWVTLKLAAGLDGRTAMESGESRWITGAAARRDVHRLRGEAAAVVTGRGTVGHDDPRLTARDVAVALDDGEQPLRVILDRTLRTPSDAAALREPGTTCVVHVDGAEDAARALRDAGAEVHALPGGPGGVDVVSAVAFLAAREINHVLVEAGATVAGAFLQARLVDEVVLYQAPHWMGELGKPLARLPGLSAMAQRLRFRYTDVRRVGEDLRVTAEPVMDSVTDDD